MTNSPLQHPSLVGYAACLHTWNHLIKEIGRVRHPAKRTAGKRRINIEEATGTCYTSPCVKKLHEVTEKICKEKIDSFV